MGERVHPHLGEFRASCLKFKKNKIRILKEIMWRLLKNLSDSIQLTDLSMINILQYLDNIRILISNMCYRVQKIAIIIEQTEMLKAALMIYYNCHNKIPKSSTSQHLYLTLKFVLLTILDRKINDSSAGTLNIITR